jgi:CheY-like chemotaxis protein
LTRPAAPASPGSANVLVVDDDYDIRFTMKEILEEEGYRVVMASHGAEALELLRRGPRPALIFLDLMMPIMDGFLFCQEWRLDAALHQIPVVIISADAATKAKAEACGATGFLSKPIQLRDLMAVTEQYTRAA